jgi:hypothetical protein
MKTLAALGLTVFSFFAATARSAYDQINDPPKASLAVVTQPLADIEFPKSFFGADVRFADQFGPYVIGGRNGGPSEARVVYDLRSGKPVAELQGKQPIGGVVALSPDGSRIASATGRIVTVLDVRNGERLSEFIAAEHDVQRLQFIDDQRLLANADKTYALWDAVKGQELKKLPAVPGAQGLPAVSPGGKYFAIAEAGKVRIVSLDSGMEAASLKVPEGLGCHLVAFAPEGTHVAGLFSNFQKLTVLIWDLGSGMQVADHAAQPFHAPFYDGPKLAWSPDGKGYLLNGEAIYDRATGKVLWKLPQKHGRVQLLAVNHAVAVTDVPGKRLLKSHQPGAVAAAGGSSSDAALPRLTESKLTAAKQVTVPLGGGAWQAKLAPGEDASQLAARPFKLGVNSNEIGPLRMTAPPRTVLAVGVHTEDATLPAAVESYDLLTGKKLGRMQAKGPGQLLGIDPEGKQVLLETDKGERLDVYALSEGKHIAGWRPYAQEDEKHRAVTFALLLNERQALTGNAANKLIWWSLPTCTAELIAEAPNLAHLRLTPDSKHLIAVDGDRLRVFDVATGQSRGETAPAKPNFEARARALALRPDAGEAAVLFVSNKPEARCQLVRWDLASGKVVDALAFQAHVAPNAAAALAYAGDHYFLINNSELLDIKRKEVIWKYSLAWGAKVVAQPPDLRTWYAVADVPGHAASLVAHSLPEEGATAIIAKLTGGADAVLRPGATITVRAELSGDQAERIRNGLIKNVEASLKRLGVASGDSDAKLTLTVSERDTAQTAQFRSMFPKFGSSPFARSVVRLRELECRATLRIRDETVWEAPPARFGMHTIGIVHLPRSADDIGSYLRGRMWDSALEWGNHLELPRYLARTDEGILSLPGTSALRTTGPALAAPAQRPRAKSR